jgi:hypothetical protein
MINNNAEFYVLLCLNTASKIEYEEIPDIDSIGDNYYAELITKRNNRKLESIIISFYLICFRVRELNNSKDSLIKYAFENNMSLKSAFNKIIDSIPITKDFRNGIDQLWSEQHLNNDSMECLKKLKIYSLQRFGDYETYITSLVLVPKLVTPDNLIEQILSVINISQFYNNPFKQFFDIKLFSETDYYLMGEDKILEMKFESNCLWFSITDSYDLICKNIF